MFSIFSDISVIRNSLSDDAKQILCGISLGLFFIIWSYFIKKAKNNPKQQIITVITGVLIFSIVFFVVISL